jgi:hypothetical protein
MAILFDVCCTKEGKKISEGDGTEHEYIALRSAGTCQQETNLARLEGWELNSKAVAWHVSLQSAGSRWNSCRIWT